MYFEIPILLISILLIIMQLTESETVTAGALTALAWPILAGIIWILIVRKKDYQHYFGKAYIIETLENSDSLSRIKDINYGLDYYNKYLQSYGNKIANMNEIKSKFSNSSIEEQKNIIRPLAQAFDTDDKGNQKKS
jgi:hypothetical protein